MTAVSTYLRKAFSLQNLRLAWQWTRSNPDAQFKNYFRDIYKAYAMADEAYLASLRRRLTGGTFRPSHAAKIYLLKPSGILRPYSLLNVEDQISYQALANVVADRLGPRVRHRYNKEIFGHLYAGRSSLWFYRKWSDGYRRFNAAIATAYRSGHIYAATFDLTAFYDSIAHTVLRHFLDKLGLDQDFIALLLTWLETWTATHERIYHGHGIPQGPQPSGLLSEAVLQYFDANRKRLPRDVRYFRYVDDIRLYAKREESLKRALITLDYLSKNLGLFPQSAKIQVRRVTSLRRELRSVSRPPESVTRTARKDPRRVRERLVQLSPRFRIEDETRFKYVLAFASPDAKTALRLLKILDRMPHLHPNVFRYVRKFDRLPKSVSKELYARLRDSEPYNCFKADLLDATLGRIDPAYRHHFVRYVEKAWKDLRRYENGPDLQAVALRWLLAENRLPYANVREALVGASAPLDPWVRTSALFWLERATVGPPSYEAILNEAVRVADSDRALSAAFLLLDTGSTLHRPTRDVNHLASWGLKVFGIIRSRSRAPSFVHKALEDICDRKISAMDWRGEFKRKHKLFERHLILAHGYVKTDMTAWVNAMNVVHDRLLDALVPHDGTVGTYTLGQIGSFIGSGTSRFATKYPRLHAACVAINELRKRSVLAHPVSRTTGRPTGAIPFKELRRVRPVLHAGYQEVIRLW